MKASHDHSARGPEGGPQRTTLIVPGFHGSGPDHWQSWFEARLPEARRVIGIDWEAPVLARWAGAVRDAIDRAPGPVWWRTASAASPRWSPPQTGPNASPA